MQSCEHITYAFWCIDIDVHVFKKRGGNRYINDTSPISCIVFAAVSPRYSAIQRTIQHDLMYRLPPHVVRALMYRLGDTSRYNDTAIQRDTSNLMYHHPSDRGRIYYHFFETGSTILESGSNTPAPPWSPLVEVGVRTLPHRPL